MKELILKYLHQPSTWRGILSLLIAAGCFTMRPEVIDSTVASILLVIGALEGIKGTINIVRDENKKKVEKTNEEAITKPKSTDDTVKQLQLGDF